jgi:arsenite-transporting ATPase
VEQRLIIISGKGGVGKTIFSLALAKHLSKTRKILYNNFDQDPPGRICEGLKIPYLKLEENKSLKSYITKKLGSKTIASWVIKAPFFTSLFQIIPGLRNLVFLGHIIDLLLEDPDLTIVLDCPSSGHALTLFETPINFKEILRKGPLVKDILVIEEIIHDPKFCRTFILFLPSLLAFHEAEELRTGLVSLNLEGPELILNGSFSNMPGIPKEELPPFLREKSHMEKLVLDEYKGKYGKIEKLIPHIPENDQEKLILKIEPLLGRFCD